VRADARRSFPARPVWYDSLDAFRRAGDEHAAPGKHMFVVAAADMQARIRRLPARAGRAAPPSARPRGGARGGSNEDENTAKEVR
jgi:hypothetical protein